MIKREYLEQLRKEFVHYTNQFTSNDFFVQRHFGVKQEHTFRVCECIVEIGKRLELNEDQLLIAETIALLHDIGRFEQYKQYQTFSDFESTDHATLGVQVINELGLLNDIDPNTKSLVTKAILNHNKPVLKDDKDDVTFYSKLIRDADKLDIFRVVKEYEQLESNLGVQDDKKYKIPDFILNAFTRHQTVSYKDVKSRNDMTLLRVSWIFDINFHPTFQLLDQRDYLNHFLNLIPKSYRLINIQEIVRNYTVEKIFSYA